MTRLSSDRSGNTLALIAAAIAPIMALVGGGVDMSRSYLSQSRLQQACDAGVLAARKRLGSEAVVTGEIPEDTAEVGNRFFNVNFRDGAYGTTNREFQMKLEDNYSISGTATADVPTTIMKVFGFDKVPVAVECEAQINFNNTDVMMVLDVTGSMNESNPGDGASRIETLKDTVSSFHAQLEVAASAGTRVRYGFVPYSTNVNVGGLLKPEWLAGQWQYQSRKLITNTGTATYQTFNTASSPVSGSKTESPDSTYAASFEELAGYFCPTTPANTLTSSSSIISTTTEPVLGPPAGTRTTRKISRTRNGATHSVAVIGTTCQVTKTTYVDYIDQYNQITEPKPGSGSLWYYGPLPISFDGTGVPPTAATTPALGSIISNIMAGRRAFDTTEWGGGWNGCVEERDTYEITSYDNVDLSRALDLDLDRVPTAGDTATQWRRMLPEMIYGRDKEWNGAGSFKKNFSASSKEFIAPSLMLTAACPPAARKMSTITSEELETYMDTMVAGGSTYHDIGMIWGGRLLSPTGIFAGENADESESNPTSRNLIFLTDGQTSSLDVSYTSYGMEPVDQRRWQPGSSYSLTQTVENRFAFACSEVRKKNITVWVIGFGTTLNPVMKECAGAGHYFEAADAVELNATFATIARKMSQLRIMR